MIRPIVPLALLLGLTACASLSRPHGEAAQHAACVRRADEVYSMQNRDAVYRADDYATSGRDAKFSGSGFLNAPSLGDRYARERMLDNCLDARTGTPGGPVAAPAPAASPDAVKTAPPPPKP